MRRVVLAAVCAMALLAGAVASAEPGPPGPWGRRSVSLLSATALQRLVKLQVRVRGARRWLIYVDGHLSGFSTSTVGFARVTRPGPHRIFVALAGRDGAPLQPLIRSRALSITLARSAGPVVAAAGDIACDPNSAAFNDGRGSPRGCHQLATSNLLVNAGLKAVLALGDLQYYCGAEAAFMAAYDPSWGRVKAITYPTPGNHEYQAGGAYGCAPPGGQGYFAYWGAAAGDPSRGYYSFDLGAWHVVSLNSNCDAIGGAELLLNGDEHNYERFAPQTPQGAADPTHGIREFVVGTGGQDLRPFGTKIANSEVRQDDTFGVLELTLLPTSYTWQFIPEAGGTFTDSGSSPCHCARRGPGPRCGARTSPAASSSR